MPSMICYPKAAVERAMKKVQEVILRAMAKKITWWQAAEIIGISQSCSKDVKSAMEAIILEVDEIVVKPIEIKQLAGMVRERLRIRKPANRTGKERVSDILHRRSDFIVQNWPVNWTTLRFRIASGLAIFPNW
jgi:PleD family two-component response regulator